MAVPLEDSLMQRFASFWIGLGSFLLFGFLTLVYLPFAGGSGDGDPTLDGGEVGAARADTRAANDETQAGLLAGYGVSAAAAGVAAELGAAKPEASKAVVPNTPTAQRILEEQAAAAAAAVADAAPGAQAITLKAIPAQMKYDLTEFTVKAGEPVIITLQNPDALQHNIVIGVPGSKDAIGNAATLMAAEPDAMAKGYVPEIPEVLYASKLINPNETGTLEFTAPDVPGDYPYVCTFPGHWILMNGVMKVTK